MNKQKYFLLGILLLCLTSSCIRNNENYTPKPVGYFRIALPEHKYVALDTNLPFKFDYSTSSVCDFSKKEDGNYWINIKYPSLNAELNMTYIPLNNDLRTLAIEEEKMIQFHIDKGKADDVYVDYINDPANKVYGRIHHLEGTQVASTLQFWVTDSIEHYLRASLYFNFAPNNDSLQPVINYLNEDVLEIINTLYWK